MSDPLSAPRMQVDDDDDEDVAAKAYAAITAQLQQFTSPKLGSLPPRGYDDPVFMEQYDSDAEDDNLDSMEWMEQDLQQPSPVKTPKRAPLMERANTPIMSNSSSKRGKSPESRLAMDSLATMPAFQVIARPKVYSPRAAPVVTTTTTNPSLSPFVFRRYHDTLWAYLKAKRSLSNSLELERKGQALEAMTLDDPAPVASSLASREQRTEVDFLSQLQQLGWSTPSDLTYIEGDFWMLLVTLRQLGLSALIWEDDSVSAGQNARALNGYLQELANRVDATPAEILQRLASNQAPLVLQRRYSLLQWIQICLDQVRVEAKPASKFQNNTSATAHPDDTPSLVPEPALQNLLEASLGFILAGRLEDAKALVRSQGQSWRAAAWSGGQAVGYEKQPNPEAQTMDVQLTGNPHRFLWKRQVWKNARRAVESPQQQVEAAIYAVLANDVQTCLASPNLRSWPQAMGATLSAVWGRLEDQVLHWHNNQRRAIRTNLPYPGTEHEKQEAEQLVMTSPVASLTEAQALQLLASSPFPEIRGQNAYTWAMASFCVGKSAILDYCRLQTENMVSGDQNGDEHLVHLRFLTHLTLFLDSLQVSTTPIFLPELTEQKNQVLFEYLRYMESRPELWHLTTLYVSLLPEQILLEWYPTILAKILDDTERQSTLESMQSLFPHLVLNVLKLTVRLCLGDALASDESKCQSLQWLLMEENHAGEALVCSNILLREFFLDQDDEKMDVAMQLVEDHLPADLVERAPDDVASARTEHLAFLTYLDAYRTFGKWKDVLLATPTTIMDSLGVDMHSLNATEQAIATQRRVRDWARQKKKHCQTLLEAAEQARIVLLGVLTHPGGWLAVDEDETAKNDEERQRHRDMKTIQSRYLVLAVNLYHQVCEETALWMSRSLDNSLHMTREQALETLQESAYQPDMWYQYALDLAIVIADDRHGIHKALGPNDLKDILGKLAETEVSKLMSAS